MFIDPHSIGGKQVLAWVDAEVERKRHLLEKFRPDSNDETQYARGQLKAFRVMAAKLREKDEDESAS